MNRAIPIVAVALGLLATPQRVSGAPQSPPVAPQPETVACETTSNETHWVSIEYSVPSGVPSGHELDDALQALGLANCADECPFLGLILPCDATFHCFGASRYLYATRLSDGSWVNNYIFTGKFMLGCASCEVSWG